MQFGWRKIFGNDEDSQERRWAWVPIMKGFVLFILGCLVGGSWVAHQMMPGYSGEGPKVFLNGGSLTSSTIGVIYGYVDDMEGCSIHAAGMNYYYQADEATKEKIMKAAGMSYCSFEAVR